ncbi:serine/alanine racemase [Ruminiclostridium hungatei]|uniref:Serine/alanine racemase n=1 Tax=Ruminiclostridium hungatei TaxID=48256 RepID=A0A1V4SM88_RUMHU|nr:acyltransferase [Ruminiclostridium hungatei]OPX44341.1 serine/alanine racemase [Ruminiclostridium hungatei]
MSTPILNNECVPKPEIASNYSVAIRDYRLSKYNSIDILRLLCAIMVVAIHTTPFTEFEGQAGYYAAYVFPRLGVPFFFAVSGYFYIRSLLQGKKIFVKYLKRLAAIYVLWSFIYFLVDFIQAVRYDYSLVQFAKGSLFDFFITGSHYQLWFFPTLVFCVITVTMLKNHMKLLCAISILLYLAGCLAGAYYGLGSSLPPVKAVYDSPHLELIRRNLFMGLPFFLLGYLLYIIYPKLEKLKGKVFIFALGASSVLYISEIVVVRNLKLNANIITSVFLYPLLAAVLTVCLRYPLPNSGRAARFCKTSANFIYYSHPLYMFIAARLLSRLFNLSLPPTPEFLLTCSITLLSSYIIFRLDNRYLNKLVQ